MESIQIGSIHSRTPGDETDLSCPLLPTPPLSPGVWGLHLSASCLQSPMLECHSPGVSSLLFRWVSKFMSQVDRVALSLHGYVSFLSLLLFPSVEWEEVWEGDSLSCASCHDSRTAGYLEVEKEAFFKEKVERETKFKAHSLALGKVNSHGPEDSTCGIS